MFALLLIAWPLAELVVAIEIARAIGVLAMLLLLILSWPLGTWALRSQGRVVWRRLALASAEGRPPGREVIDGALVLIGGTLMLVPGFITDAVGLLCLLPPTRLLLRSLLVRNLQSRLLTRAFRVTGVHEYDVDSTAHDVEPPHLKA
jgi:UPF0716 protein FxsA